MGGALTMVGNSPLILLNDLLQSANNNLPSGMATLEPLRMFAPLPIGVVLSSPRCCTSASAATACWPPAKTAPAATSRRPPPSYFPDLRHRRRRVRADRHHRKPAGGHVAGRCRGPARRPLMLALQTGEDALAPPADMRIWVGSVLGVMGRARRWPTSPRTSS
jgi:hypothetical protein